MKKYLMRYEPNKGYIPSDKVTVSGQHFESFSFSHIEGLAEKWDIIKKAYISDIYNNTPKNKNFKYYIDDITTEFLTVSGYSHEDDYPNYPVLYFNFNHDMVQVFINRGFDNKK